MRFAVIMLLFLLGGSILMSVIRKLRGGTFMPPPGSDGNHHVQDRSLRWWRYGNAVRFDVT
jgi:hypothetical protein